MRIVIDMQGAQTESRFRGIGRYTMSFARGVVCNRDEHEIILALSGLFPETIEPVRAAFDGLLPQENILVWQAPGPVREVHPGNETRRGAAELIREAFLAALQPDVIHISSLFEGYVDDAVTSINRFDKQTPVSLTLYDLIPLLNPEHYHRRNPRYEQYYRRKVGCLKQAASFLAISEFTRQEGLAHLGVQQSRVVNISTAVEPCFQPLTIDKNTAAQVCQKIGVTRPFVLYTGGADERKNLSRLIQAYAAMPALLRQGHQLLFAGKMSEGDIAGFKKQAKSADLKPDELCFTGYVSDEELVQLYNLCKLYVFPSWHEGFGLPALEAMACGAPVIAANTSSLPEVIGLDESLFDPLDVTAISAKMQKGLKDDAFRHRLREHGLQRAKLFSWDSTAKRAMAAWEKLHVGHDKKPQSHRSSWLLASQKLDVIYRQLINEIAAAVTSGVHPTDAGLRLLAHCLERNECRAKSFIRTKPLPEKVVWRIEGPFDSSYSLALVNRETARAMEGLKHTVVLHSTEGPGDFPANEQFLQKNPDLAEMHQRALTVPQAEADVTSRNLYPPRVADMNCRLNLLHAYGWEESGFPHEWTESFNQFLQGMTVMSEHVKKIMVDNGVTVPIAVSGIGVDHWERVQPDNSFKIQARTFRFLHISSCFPRKGADRMLKAYGQAFSAHDDVTLVIKTFQNPHNEIHRWLEEARSTRADYPDVLILEGDYTEAQLKALYEQCQALVAPSLAEGFGLPMAEAMLSGLAVITTGWGGQLDFCTPQTSWLVDYRFERARTHFNLYSSVWAEPDIDHLVHIMREVFLASGSDRQSRVCAGRKLLLHKYRWSHAAERMVNAARQWSQVREQSEPSIGWISTWNERCGIAAYSEHLIRNLPGKVSILAARSQELTAQDQANVHRCWTAGDLDPLDDLRRSIEHIGMDTLVVQFNYGFFDLEVLAEFLVEQIDAGRVVVVMMHATTDPTHAPHKKLSCLVPAFSRCHRILVHSPKDMNHLKTYGLVKNVALFPHGIPDFVPAAEKMTEKGKKFVVGSYGFFLPHKGLLELIEAIALLRSQGELVELKMLNAEYPVPESRMLIKDAMHKINSLNLKDVVTVCTDYLEGEACLSGLAEVDLIVFPYQETAESSSAAVRYGLATARPVAVTPLPIFEDVSAAVFKLPGQTPQDIAAGIREIRQKLDSCDSSPDDVRINSEQWRAQHLYSVVGQRLFNIIQAIRRDGLDGKQGRAPAPVLGAPRADLEKAPCKCCQ